MVKMSESPTKKIGDASLISYLIVSKFKPVKKAPWGGRVFFEFEDTPELEKACYDFYDRNTSVDALTILETYLTTRQMIRELVR